MEILTTREKQFQEIIKVFQPQKVPFPETNDLLLYYYYNLDYNGKKEEEHKLQAWSQCMDGVFEKENRLLLPIDDLVVSLSHTVEDEKKLTRIIKHLKKTK